MSSRQKQPRRRAAALVTTGVVTGLASLMVLVGAVATPGSPDAVPAASSAEASAPDAEVAVAVKRVEDRLARVPADARAWANLALLYVDQVRLNGDTALYDRAAMAVTRSLRLGTKDNDAGYAALAALSNARHDFAAALTAAEKGLQVNAFSANLLSMKADALTQLGRYDQAAAAVDRLNQLHPGVPAFARTSFLLELQGDVAGARRALERALAVATSKADKVFVLGLLGELALSYQGKMGGSGELALRHFDEGLRLQPGDTGLREGRAHALLTLGRSTESRSEYAELAASSPVLPQALIMHGELQQAAGQADDAARTLARLDAEFDLLRSTDAPTEADEVLFLADHGSATEALKAARRTWRNQPFLGSADAMAWALHRNGDNRTALTWSERALATGWPSALALYHRGAIKQALGDDAGAAVDLRRALDLNPAFHPLWAPAASDALARAGGATPAG